MLSQLSSLMRARKEKGTYLMTRGNGTIATLVSSALNAYQAFCFLKALPESKNRRQSGTPHRESDLPAASHVVSGVTSGMGRYLTWRRIYAACFISTCPS